jgi:hypothetical protein
MRYAVTVELEGSEEAGVSRPEWLTARILRST